RRSQRTRRLPAPCPGCSAGDASAADALIRPRADARGSDRDAITMARPLIGGGFFFPMRRAARLALAVALEARDFVLLGVEEDEHRVVVMGKARRLERGEEVLLGGHGGFCARHAR